MFEQRNYFACLANKDAKLSSRPEIGIKLLWDPEGFKEKYRKNTTNQQFIKFNIEVYYLASLTVSLEKYLVSIYVSEIYIPRKLLRLSIETL